MTGGKALRWKGASLFSGQKEGCMAGGETSNVAGGQEVRLGLVCLGSTTPMQGSERGAAESPGGQHASGLGRPFPHHRLSLQLTHLVAMEPAQTLARLPGLWSQLCHSQAV